MGFDVGGTLLSGGVLDVGGALDSGGTEDSVVAEEAGTEDGMEDSTEEAAEVSFSTEPVLNSKMISPTNNRNSAPMVAIKTMVRLLLR